MDVQDNLEVRVEILDEVTAGKEWQRFMFYAYLGEERIGKLDVSYIESQYLNSPFIFSMRVEPEYRGNGIAGLLVENAIDYFRVNHRTNLSSGMSNNREAERVYEKLTDKGRACETLVNDRKVWIFK